MLDKLTDTKVSAAKAKATAYKLTDGGGMYLLVSPKAQKWWRFDYRVSGRRKTMALGVYPEVSLKAARERRREAREQVARGEDPSEVRKAKKAERVHTFASVAKDWMTEMKPSWVPKHFAKVLGRLEQHVFPWLGQRPLTEIDAADIEPVLTRLQERGHLESAHRVREHIGQIFRWAIRKRRVKADPTQELRGFLPGRKAKHFASITDPKQIAALLRAIAGYQGQFVTQQALKLAPLVFVRPGELRHAEWSEIDLEAGEWRIPAAKMKMTRAHIVPLSKQAIAVLKEIQPVTGKSRYVFPSMRTNTRPMSENTVTGALRRLGYSGDEMTGHGFRSLASTRLNEMGWNRDAIERQLAHVEDSKVRAAYNHAEYLTERRQMMQAWADYLEALQAGADVVPMLRRVSRRRESTRS